MSKQIFVNLSTKDLEKAKSFFTGIGFTINPQFTDSNAVCLVISENIFAMVLTEDFFKHFTKKEIVDAHKYTEVNLALSVESKEQVDEIFAKAISLGATENPPADFPQPDFMYGKSFSDLDGHIWEIFWMDKEKLPEKVGEQVTELVAQLT